MLHGGRNGALKAFIHLVVHKGIMSVRLKSSFNKSPSGDGEKGGEGMEHQNKLVVVFHSHEEEEAKEEFFIPTKVEKESVLTSVVMSSKVESALGRGDKRTYIPHQAAKQALELFRDQEKVIQDGRAAYDNLYSEYSLTHEILQDAEEMMRVYQAKVISLEERENKWKRKARKWKIEARKAAAVTKKTIKESIEQLKATNTYLEEILKEGKNMLDSAALLVSRAIQS
jgi:hypothetical protein